jgi:5'-deoxynucleotidase YfbR-like HD superfamily hydrolase
MNIIDLYGRLPRSVKEHSERVAFLTDYYTADLDDKITNKCFVIGLLHDLLEDTEFTAEDIQQDDIREAVVILTRKADEPYFEYIQRIIDSDNEYAYFVKLADISDHLLQIETLTPSLKDRYEKALRMLRGV